MLFDNCNIEVNGRCTSTQRRLKSTELKDVSNLKSKEKVTTVTIGFMMANQIPIY